MFCTQCGTRLDDNARFCTACGKPVGAEPATAHPRPGSGKKLRRIVAQKKIAGVCAGFAEYFDADISLMRIIWIALLLLPPSIGLIAYIIAWVVLPRE
jgi:phage shock protein C